MGGGGKTSLLLTLARELAQAGHSVAVTTTTHIYRPRSGLCDCLLTDGSPETLTAALAPGRVVCAALPAPGGKLSAPPPEVLAAAARADWLLAEADGSRQLPVKAPAAHEPVLLKPYRAVVAVAGLSALGHPLSLVCHRPELACALLDVPPETSLTPELLARLLTSPLGQFKGVGEPGRLRLFLNQADTPAAGRLGEQTARLSLALLPGCRAVVAALRPEPAVKGVFSHADFD